MGAKCTKTTGEVLHITNSLLSSLDRIKETDEDKYLQSLLSMYRQDKRYDKESRKVIYQMIQDHLTREAEKKNIKVIPAGDVMDFLKS